MCFGFYLVKLFEGFVVVEIYGCMMVEECYCYCYEVNNVYCGELEEVGLVFFGILFDGGLVEFVELPREVYLYYVLM